MVWELGSARLVLPPGFEFNLTAMQSQSVFSRGAGIYGWLVKCGKSLQSPFLLAVRLYWGWQFAQTGWGKLQHLPKVTEFFAGLGIPAPAVAAPSIASLELLGGILLALGLGSRLIGLLLTGNMIAAYITAGRENLLAVFSNPGKFYGDDAYTFLFAAALIFIFGPGKFAVDELIRRSVAQQGANDVRLMGQIFV